MKAKKSLGQNFLQDNNVIDKIVNSVDVSEDDLIIEIGPGQGALTKKLKNKKASLIAFEIDERMHECLDQLVDNKTTIIFEDILSVDLIKLLTEKKYNKLYVVANLPYYITTPIIEKLINLDIKIDSMVVMVQNEVADRFCAKPKTRDYGYMTVLLNAFYDVEKLFIVKNTCFIPAPKVDSAVIKFNPKEKKFDYDKEKFKKLVSLSFAHKRKTLKNNLPDDIWKKIVPYLVDKDISLSVRAEELSTDVYIDFSNLV